MMKNITYVYDVDWDWNITVETTPKLSSNYLRSKGLVWSAYDASSGKYLFAWKPVSSNSQLFEIEFKDQSDLNLFLPLQKRLKIVIAQSNGTPIYFLDIGKFCTQFSEKVINLTNPTGIPCEADDLNPPRDACKEFGDRLETWVKKGAVPCKLAESQYEKGSPVFPDAVNCTPRKFCP